MQSNLQGTLQRAAVIAALVATTAGSASAQGRGRSSASIPPGFRPPAGMCRVWIPGVPPGQQPGVTDCVTARASAPANARIVYGDQRENPAYRGRVGTYSRTVYDPNGNRVLQRVRRNTDGTLSVLSSQLLGGTVYQNYPNTNGCTSEPRGHSGKWKVKCKGGDENEQGDDDDRDERGSRGHGDENGHGHGNGHGRHGH